MIARDGLPDLGKAIVPAYRKKYWLLVPLWMGCYIRKGIAEKTSVLIRTTPQAPANPAIKTPA